METLTKELLLNHFPNLERDLATELVGASTLKVFNEGQEAMRKGQYIRSTVLVLEGLLKVIREDDQGNEFFMYYLQPGNACALSIMCEDRSEKSEIMLKAAQDSRVILIPAHLSELWLGKYKSWHNFVISSYRSRFEELLQTLDSIVFKSLDQRLIFYLKRHQSVSGNEIRISHQQIASELNSSREVISRLLKKLEQSGALTLHRNSIELSNLDQF